MFLIAISRVSANDSLNFQEQSIPVGKAWIPFAGGHQMQAGQGWK
jgi:hypothetical protein